MSFVYEPEIIRVKINGKDYEIKEPTVIQQRALRKDFEQASGGDSDVVKIYSDFFSSLGLPVDAIESMSLRGLISLFEYTIGLKKS